MTHTSMGMNQMKEDVEEAKKQLQIAVHTAMDTLEKIENGLDLGVPTGDLLATLGFFNQRIGDVSRAGQYLKERASKLEGAQTLLQAIEVDQSRV